MNPHSAEPGKQHQEGGMELPQAAAGWLLGQLSQPLAFPKSVVGAVLGRMQAVFSPWLQWEAGMSSFHEILVLGMTETCQPRAGHPSLPPSPFHSLFSPSQLETSLADPLSVPCGCGAKGRSKLSWECKAIPLLGPTQEFQWCLVLYVWRMLGGRSGIPRDRTTGTSQPWNVSISRGL